MTKKLIGRKEIALVHVAKASLAMREEEYRKLLKEVGASSSKLLTYLQFDELMDRFKALGFRSSGAKAKGVATDYPKEKQPMLSKIGTILAELGMPLSYADRVAKKMFGIDRLRWCSCEQTWKVLQALIIFQNRKGAAKENTG